MHTFLKYSILIFLLLFLGGGRGNAQNRQKTISIYTDKEAITEDGKTLKVHAPVPDVFVYSFFSESSAEKAYNRVKKHQTDELEKQDDFLDFGKTKEDGMVEINVPDNAWLLIYNLNINVFMSPIQVTAEDALKNVLEYKLGESSVIQMNVITVAGDRSSVRKPVTATASSCNGELVIASHPIFLDSAYTRANARFVLSPVVVSRHNPQDTIAYLPPRVLDGVAYDLTQKRFMGFDLKNDKYWQNVGVFGEEPSENYFAKGMNTREEDTLFFRCRIRPYDDKKPWKIVAHYWYEDYNTVYYENNLLIYPGYPSRPTHFLEWKSSVPKVELDDTHYARRALTEPVQSSQNLKLLFKSGQADLDFSDSVTVASLEEMYKFIAPFQDNSTDRRITSFDIQGFASPEGRETINRTLALKRGQTVKALFAQRYPNLPLSVQTAGIFKWEEVADSIDALQNPEYAGVSDELREICLQKRDFDSQNSVISRKSWFSKVKENILPRMRRVTITTGIVEQKKLSTEEIFGRYKQDKGKFLNGEVAAYQYYQLLNKLYKDARRNGNWKDLEELADAVCRSVDPQLRETTTRTYWEGTRVTTSKGEEKEKIKEGNPFERPYPLAAYYKAVSELEQEKVDTTILKNYLDSVANQGLYTVKEGNKHWNEEAVAITQIMMYCLAGKYKDAYLLSQYHLPSDGRFKRFQTFIKFLSCDYSEAEKEEMRQEIEGSSDINYVVANLIDGDRGFEKARNKLINEKDKFMKNGELDATYYYLLAICRFKVECRNTDYDTYYYLSKNVYDSDSQSLMNWGAPMLEALKRDAKWVDFLKEDGFFNDAYRAMILFFWERMQQGVSMEQIALEYDELVKKYYKNNK